MESAPTLVIMAAGMGSRFGGLKQIEPVDDQGHIIIDYSLYDAYRAGFRDVVFIIKKEIEQEFRERIGDRMEKWFHIKYVFQELDKIPKGYSVPIGRTKPWGTGHAILCCKDMVDGPFAVINADDFYGPGAFVSIYHYLISNKDDNCYAMVGYRVKNTVTEYGPVARGICEVKNGLLLSITERTRIYKHGDDATFTEDGENYVTIPGDTIVSMNLWGFSHKAFDSLSDGFLDFLRNTADQESIKCEYYLPSVVNTQLKDGSAKVQVLPCEDVWYGVTYREDLESVIQAVRDMKKKEVYPSELWK